MKISVVKILYHWYGKVHKNYKNWEIQLSWFFKPYPELLFVLNFYKRTRSFLFSLLGLIKIHLQKINDADHAGYYFSLNIFGLDFDVCYKDVRHYDHDAEKFEECDIEEINRHYFESKKKS